MALRINRNKSLKLLGVPHFGSSSRRRQLYAQAEFQMSAKPAAVALGHTPVSFGGSPCFSLSTNSWTTRKVRLSWYCARDSVGRKVKASFFTVSQSRSITLLG